MTDQEGADQPAPSTQAPLTAKQRQQALQGDPEAAARLKAAWEPVRALTRKRRY